MSRDTPEIRLKSHKKACKLFIFIAAMQRNPYQLPILYHSSFINMSYQHSTHHGPNKMNRVCTRKGMFLFQLDKHQASKRPGVGFGRGRGRECPNFAGAGNWLFWNLAGAGAVNLINPRAKLELFTEKLALWTSSFQN